MKLSFQHPLPRYGVAVALVNEERSYDEAPTSYAEWAELAHATLQHGLREFMVYTQGNPFSEVTTELTFKPFAEVEKLSPGSASGQNSANGYYLAPHVLASDKTAGGTVKAIWALLKDLKEKDPETTEVALKRSFAPLTAKLNNGSPSLTEPKASLLEAAFTAIGTIASAKPAAYVITSSSNFYQSIIPDLPLYEADSGAEPLLDFVQLFAEMQTANTEAGLWEAELKPGEKKYKRPKLHRGNYPRAPQDASLGAIGLVGAIGAWSRQGQVLAERYVWAERVLTNLARRPLYLVSYDQSTQQVQFGHHIVGVALNHDIPRIIAGLYRCDLHGSTATTWTDKAGDPLWKLFRMMTGRFLQWFTPPSFRDFLAFRAQYDPSLSPILKEYFMAQHPDAELIDAAQAYGAWLNYICYIAAKVEKQNDKANRTLNEYKSRALVQLESLVHSAKSHTSLLAQLNTTAGRMAGHKAPARAHEVDAEATPFLRAVAGQKVDLGTAKDLVTAFMRLNTYTPKEGDTSGDETSKAPQQDAQADGDLFASLTS